MNAQVEHRNEASEFYPIQYKVKDKKDAYAHWLTFRDAPCILHTYMCISFAIFLCDDLQCGDQSTNWLEFYPSQITLTSIRQPRKFIYHFHVKLKGFQTKLDTLLLFVLIVVFMRKTGGLLPSRLDLHRNRSTPNKKGQKNGSRNEM